MIVIAEDKDAAIAVASQRRPDVQSWSAEQHGDLWLVLPTDRWVPPSDTIIDAYAPGGTP